MPYIILAAMAGNLETFKILLNAGCDISETGNMSFLPDKQKYTTSNVIGTAAFYGQAEIINFVMARTKDKSMLEFKAIDSGGDPNFIYL